MTNDLISKQAVFDIVDDLRDRMTVEGYWSVVERVKALPSAQTNSWCINSWCNDCKDDAISRQAAIRVASGYCHPANIADELRKLPSAQPERKTGRWIDDNCSECGQYVYHGDARNYCPNCGADMRNAVDVAKDILHNAIDNTVWAESVDVAELHSVIDKAMGGES